MSQHKIVKIPDWVTPETENYLNDIGKDGWELVHLYNQHAYLKSATGGTTISGSLDMSFDAFGRERTSQPYTLGDYKHLYTADETFINYTITGSSITFNKFASSVTLETSASNGSKAIHQTKMYHNYLPGKSQQVLNSFVLGTQVNGVTKRVGYYDDYDGIFFEQDKTGSLNFVIRSSTGGTGSNQITENRVPQSQWNVNTLQSGDFVLDVTKSQLLFIDFQWLAVGRVRMGFVYKGIFVLCHVFDHTNILDKAYMANPSLPVRTEIFSSGSVSGSMEHICSSVASEGGYTESGVSYGVTSPTLRNILANATVPVLSIRLKNSLSGLPVRHFVRVNDLSVFTEDQTIKYRLVKLPSSASLTGGSLWQSVHPSSSIEFNTSSTAFTGGDELLNGFVFAGGTGVGNAIAGQGQRGGVSTKSNYIAQNIDSSDSEVYAIVCTNMTGTATDVGVGITWTEVY